MVKILRSSQEQMKLNKSRNETVLKLYIIEKLTPKEIQEKTKLNKGIITGILNRERNKASRAGVFFPSHHTVALKCGFFPLTELRKLRLKKDAI